jgi:hypothetical protein
LSSNLISIQDDYRKTLRKTTTYGVGNPDSDWEGTKMWQGLYQLMIPNPLF